MQKSISQFNQLSQADFVRIIGPVFENSLWIAEAAWPQRPFANRTALQQALCRRVLEGGEEKQVALIRAHPDLAGRAALAGTLGRASTNEQASAGLDTLSPQEIEEFRRSNAAYHERFGFPFVICARLNRKEAILAGFRSRLGNSREREIQIAMEEIFKIAELRLADLIHE